MTYKEKLINLLKTNEEDIKKDLEDKNSEYSLKVDEVQYLTYRAIPTWIDKIDKEDLNATWDSVKMFLFEHFDILEERHLRIYCKSNWIRFNTQENDVILLRKWSANEDYFWFQWSKSFENQSDEVYEKIFNFLNEYKNKCK